MPNARAVVLTVLALVTAAAGEIATRDLAYRDGDANLKGFLATPPAGAGAAPGVLVAPEWWGLNDYAKRRAQELAGLGYVALAIDIYGDGRTTTDPQEAGTLAKPWREDRAALRRRAHAALEALRGEKGVDAKRIGAIGFCFGGTAVLELARSGADLAGVVSLHGGLATPTPAAPGTITAPLLILHGGADSFVPPSELAAFIGELNDAKATWRMEVYGGAVHAFTNRDAGNDPAKGLAYDADAERRAIAAMQAFLAERFAAGHR